MAHLDINFISNALGRAVDITLILPTKTSPTLEPDYDAKNNTYYQDKKNKKYPLLILLHGLLNDEKNWYRYARAEFYAEENNIAICMVSGENKFFMNWENGPVTNDLFYDFIEYELKDFLYGTFPISNKREDNFIAGLSMGGFGALYHGLKNSRNYNAIAAFSAPYTQMREMGVELKKLIGRKTDIPFIYISCGDKDSLYQDNVDLHKDMEDCGLCHIFNVVPGFAHEWRFWDMELERFIKGLKRTDPYKADSPRGV